MGNFHYLMASFGDFLVAPPATLQFTLSFFGQENVFRWYMSQPSFIYDRLLVPQFSNFKCFHGIRKYNFRSLLDCLLKVTPQIVVKFVRNFNQ